MRDRPTPPTALVHPQLHLEPPLIRIMDERRQQMSIAAFHLLVDRQRPCLGQWQVHMLTYQRRLDTFLVFMVKLQVRQEDAGTTKIIITFERASSHRRRPTFLAASSVSKLMMVAVKPAFCI
jgi:hypothetical protein